MYYLHFFVWYSQCCYPRVNFFLLWIALSSDAPTVDPSGIKTHVANGLITFFINSKPVFINGSRSLARKPHDFIIFDSFILADKLFVKALRRFATFLLVSNT